MPSSPEQRFDFWWLFLLAAGALLMLSNLGDGNGLLWQDEAETAVLGKNTLRFGYPKAFDGVNRLNPALKVAAGAAWPSPPWLSFYAAAGSFALLGPTTFAARLPFALMGIASLLLFYGLVQRMTEDRSLARWASLLLMASVPFLLHMRQCRYYAPSVLLSLWAVLAYLRFCERRPWSLWEFAAAMTLLFHANHGVFLPLALALALHFMRYGGRLLRGLGLAAIVLALTGPFAFLLAADQHHGDFSWKEISHHAQFYFRQINKFLLPVVPWAVALLIWRPRFAEIFGEKGTPARRAFGLAGWILTTGYLFLIFGPWQRHFRYLVFMIPWFLLVHAALLRGLFKRNRMAGGLALLLVFFTLESRPRCLLLNLAGELTHASRGPMDGVIELLREKGRAGQTVKIPYGDHAVLFYTGMVLDPVVRPEDFLKETYPDWIVVRKDWIPGEFFGSAYDGEIHRRYRKHALDVPDIQWQNRPDPGYHRFRTDRQAPPVAVFEKVS